MSFPLEDKYTQVYVGTKLMSLKNFMDKVSFCEFTL